MLNEGLKPHWSTRPKPSRSGAVLSLARDPQVAANRPSLGAFVPEAMALPVLVPKRAGGSAERLQRGWSSRLQKPRGY